MKENVSKVRSAELFSLSLSRGRETMKSIMMKERESKHFTFFFADPKK